MSRVAIDARKLRDGGIGTYIRELIGALAARPEGLRLVALVDPRDAGTTAWPGAVEEIAVRAGKYSIAEHWVIANAARQAGAALLHAPHYTLPLAWSGPAVVTIHDLIHVRWSRFFPPGAGHYARAIAGQAARRARVVLADSTHTKREIETLLGVAGAKVRVAPLGVSPGLARRADPEVAAFRAARGLPRDYVLYVGARKPHKNLPLVLRALATIPAERRPPLVLSGSPPPADDALGREAAALGLGGAIHGSGPLGGDDELSLLYSGAALYVQPSLDEGFGLPPLEAMACGVPVLASTGGSLPETLGDAAALLPPEDPARWGAAIADLLVDAARREARARAGLAHAREFTWERAAAVVREAYADALASSGHA